MSTIEGVGKVIEQAGNVGDKLFTSKDEASQHQTSRHEKDMSSDSWLSKNARPIGLLVVYAAIIVMIVAELTGKHLSPDVIVTIKWVASMVVGFYFGGRSIEKVEQQILKNKRKVDRKSQHQN